MKTGIQKYDYLWVFGIDMAAMKEGKLKKQRALEWILHM
jgi:hypothetical protein